MNDTTKKAILLYNDKAVVASVMLHNEGGKEVPVR
jgi:hypothetical protein